MKTYSLLLGSAAISALIFVFVRKSYEISGIDDSIYFEFRQKILSYVKFILLLALIPSILFTVFMFLSIEINSYLNIILSNGGDIISLGVFAGLVFVPWLGYIFGAAARSSTTPKEQLDYTQGQFKFLTIVLGVIFVAAAVIPNIDLWMRRAQSFEFASLKIGLGRSAQPLLTGAVFAAGTSTPAFREDPGTAVAAAEQIIALSEISEGQSSTENISQQEILRLAANGHLRYGQIPTIDRDLLVILYMSSISESNTTSAREKFFDNLRSWTNTRDTDIPWENWIIEQHRLFNILSPAFRCIAQYSNNIYDFRLLAIDTHSIIRGFIEMNARGSRDIDRIFQDSPRRLSNSLNVVLTGINEFEIRMAVNRVSLSQPIHQSRCQIESWLPSTVWDLRYYSSTEDIYCRLQKSIMRTPYFAIATASLFSSIGSIESGIEILGGWLDNSDQFSNISTTESHIISECRDSPPTIHESRFASSQIFSRWMEVRSISSLAVLLEGHPAIEANAGFRAMLQRAVNHIERMRPGIQRWFERDNCGVDHNMGDIYRQTEEIIHLYYASLRARIGEMEVDLGPPEDTLISDIGQYAAVPRRCFANTPIWDRNIDYWRARFLMVQGQMLARRGLGALRQDTESSKAMEDLRKSLEVLRQAAPLWLSVRGRMQSQRDHAREDRTPPWRPGSGGIRGDILHGRTLGDAEHARVLELISQLEGLLESR